MALQVKDPVMSLLWFRWDPWPRNFAYHGRSQKNLKKVEMQKAGREKVRAGRRTNRKEEFDPRSGHFTFVCPRPTQSMS